MLRPRESTHWDKYLACKCELLSSDPQNPHEVRGGGCCVYNSCDPVARRGAETRVPKACGLASLSEAALNQKRAYLI